MAKLGVIGKMKFETFPNSVWLVKGKDIKDGVERAEKYFKMKISSGDFSTYNAVTFPLGGRIVIVGTDETKRNEWVHEIVHGALETMKYVDIPVNYDNSEVVCYLVDHIYEKLQKYLPNG